MYSVTKQAVVPRRQCTAALEGGAVSGIGPGRRRQVCVRYWCFIALAVLSGGSAQAQDDDWAWVSGALVSTAQGITEPDLSQSGSGTSKTFALDLYFQRQWANNEVFAYLWASEGDPVLYAATATAGGLSYGQIQVLSAYASRTLFDFLTVTVGKIYPTAFFDNNMFANNGYSQFQAYSFINNQTIYFPFPNLGYVIELTGGEVFAFRFTSVEESEEEQDTALQDERFVAAEMALSYFLADEYAGNFRLGLWHSGLQSLTGFYASIDQEFGLFSGLFARAGMVNGTLDDNIRFAYSAGVEIGFLDGHRVGIAYESQTPADFATFDTQSWFEGYVSFALSGDVTLTGDIQFIVNGDYDPDIEPFAVYGLRFYFPF